MTSKEANDAMLRAVWARNLPVLHDRLDLLDRAALAARANALSMELREEACAVAHKLSGTLGMFGYGAGTEAARKIEAALDPGVTGTCQGDGLAALVADLRATLPPGT